MKGAQVLWGILIIFGALGIGELIVYFTHISLPSSIIGMLLLCLSLQLGWIKIEWVKSVSDFMIHNMALFFVPPGVGLMLYFNLIRSEIVPIVVASIVSTLLVLIVSGQTHQLFRKKKDKNAA